MSSINDDFKRGCVTGDHSSSMAASRFNPLPNKPWFLRVCSASLSKTLWEKEKFSGLRIFRKFIESRTFDQDSRIHLSDAEIRCLFYWEGVCCVARYSGTSSVRSARDRDFSYGLNVVRTKKCDCVRIFPLPYADLFDQIDIACLTVPSILGLAPWIFTNVYGAKSQIQCSRYT